MPKIVVHEKALAHLSRGLYRSPASALRELVSNAWDANATVVRIDTNYPNFFQLSVEDNGKGFTGKHFEDLMAGGIGNSEKRVSETETINSRPLIGRLGIGMLGIAQICGGFTVVSKPRSGKGFRAHVKLYDLIKEKLDHDDGDVYKNEADIHHKEVDVGEFDFLPFDPDKHGFGTLILADDVHPTFSKSFKESLTYEKFTAPPLNWEKCLDIVSGVHSLQELGEYWRLLWELAASCPIPYVNAHALPDNTAKSEQERLKSYDFSVIVDGIKLAKPIRLEDNPGGYTIVHVPVTKTMVYGRILEYSGYLAVQEGKQLSPDELRGILIRIKNVGIGYYDPTFLDYRFNEGPRSRWVTGEIYVSRGLEDSLNIDRDSFNKFHPEYRTLQTAIHDKLRKELFPAVYKELDKRSRTKRDKRETDRSEVLRASIQTELGINARVETEKKNVKSSNASVHRSKENLELVLPASETLQTKKANRQLAASILGIYALAEDARDPAKRRELFKTLLLKLLRHW